MPTPSQLENVWLLSDTVLYPEAVAFVTRLVRDQECSPLPNTQVNGLLSIAGAHKYNKLYEFVVHQRDRNWPPGKRDITTFYSALEKTLTEMEKRLLRGDFHLLAGTRKGSNQHEPEAQEMMALLAREFIQHVVAENGLQGSKTSGQRPPSSRQSG